MLKHCLTCKDFNFDCKTFMFYCNLNKVESDDMIYAFERKCCEMWEAKQNEGNKKNTK